MLFSVLAFGGLKNTQFGELANDFIAYDLKEMMGIFIAHVILLTWKYGTAIEQICYAVSETVIVLGLIVGGLVAEIFIIDILI